MKKLRSHSKPSPCLTLLLVTASGLLFISQSHATIDIFDTNTYFQDFNTLPSTGAANTAYDWTNDSTLSGWYLDSQSESGTPASIRVGPSTINSQSIYIYSFGSPLNDADRAFGSVQTNTSGTNAFAFGLAFHNTSGSDVNFDAFSFWGEEYRYSGSANVNTYTAWYQISSDPILSPSADISSVGWTPLSDLDLTPPANFGNNPDGLSSGTVTDGNAANYRTFVSAALDITLANDEYIMFRFLDPDYAGTDYALGYDDMTVSWTVAAVPEASVSALLVGVTVGFFLFTRRRRV